MRRYHSVDDVIEALRDLHRIGDVEALRALGKEINTINKALASADKVLELLGKRFIVKMKGTVVVGRLPTVYECLRPELKPDYVHEGRPYDPSYEVTIVLDAVRMEGDALVCKVLGVSTWHYALRRGVPYLVQPPSLEITMEVSHALSHKVQHPNFAIEAVLNELPLADAVWVDAVLDVLREWKKSNLHSLADTIVRARERGNFSTWTSAAVAAERGVLNSLSVEQVGEALSAALRSTYTEDEVRRFPYGQGHLNNLRMASRFLDRNAEFMRARK